MNVTIVVLFDLDWGTERHMDQSYPPLIDRASISLPRLLLIGLFVVIGTVGLSTLSTEPAVAQSPTIVAACQEAIVNGSFESDTSGNWSFATTAAPGTVVNTPVHAGSNALRLGIPTTGNNSTTYSTAYQTVTIPAGVQSATLTYWERPGVGGDSGDYRELIALHTNLTILRSITRTNGNGDDQWTQRSFDLTDLAGQTLILYVNVYNNGSGSTLVTYLDELSLQLCDSAVPPTATPIATSTSIAPPPTPTATPISTPAPVRVRVGSAQAANGATSITVPLELVVLTDRVNIGVLTLNLHYNAAYLNATACTVSQALDLLLCNHTETGKIRLAGISARGIRNEVPLATLTFDLLQAVDRTVPLTIQVELTGDVDGAAVSTDAQNGTITLYCPPDSEDCSGINIYLPVVNR